jgi:HSP20 family protein
MIHARTNNHFTKQIDGLLNELFNEMPTAFGKQVSNAFLQYPAVNILENKFGFLLDVFAPALEKENFSVKVDNNILTISYQRPEVATTTENTDATFKTLKTEFEAKNFKRSFNIKDNLNTAGITAKYENGILKVWVPKKEETTTPTTEITIQ